MYIAADSQKDMEAYVARIVKKTTGRGPRNVRVEFSRDGVRFRLEGCLSPVEETLLAVSRQKTLVQQIRQSLVESWRFG